MPKTRLLQLGLVTCFASSPLIAAAVVVLPSHDISSAAIGGETAAAEGGGLEEAPRIKYASGAARSRAGWTLGTEEESVDMRVSFKVIMCFIVVKACSLLKPCFSG